MANMLIERVSALHDSPTANLFNDDNSDLTLFEVKNLKLSQITAWPDSFNAMAEKTAKALGIEKTPLPSQAVFTKHGTIFHIEPQKFLILADECPELNSNQAAMLDLSHSKTHIRIQGIKSVELLNRYISLDLRDKSFPVGTAVSTSFHHIGITLWRSQTGYEMLLPRSFSESLWDLLAEAAHQFREQNI